MSTDAASGKQQQQVRPKAVFAALGANIGIAVTKLIAALITGSASLLAESVHSAADSGNQLLLLLGRSRSRRPETEEHPFGYGAERYFYGFIVAVVMFVIGSIFSFYEGAQRLMHPVKVVSPVVAFVVLGAAIAFEGFSFRTAIRESNRTRGKASWVSYIRHAKAPELPAVLLEDSAALAGLVFALIGVTLTTVTGNDRWDGAGSIGIGILLGCVAVILAIEMRSLLIGEAATRGIEGAIVAAIEAGPAGCRVIHLRTMHLGPDRLLVAAKIAVSHDQTAGSVAAAINEAERRIRAALPIESMIFLEPDLFDAARLDPDDPAVRVASGESRDDPPVGVAGGESRDDPPVGAAGGESRDDPPA